MFVSGAEAHDPEAGLQLDGAGCEEFVGGLDVGHQYALVVFTDQWPVAFGVGQTVGQCRYDTVANELFYPSCVSKVRRAVLQGFLDGKLQLVTSVLGQQILVLLEDVLGNQHELCRCVVGKMKLIGETVV